MKKISILIFSLLLFVTFSYAQSLDEIIEKHHEAMGAKKLESVKALVIEMNMMMMGMQATSKISVKRPNKVYSESQVMGQNIVQASNGESYWMTDPRTGKYMDMPEGQAKQLLQNTQFLDGALWNYKKKGNKVELLGKETIDGNVYHKLKVYQADLDMAVDFLIDANTYLIKFQRAQVSQGGITADVETDIASYKSIEGIMFPEKIKINVNGAQQMSMDMTKVELNPQLPDSMFEKPE
ncbi:outer membrane lipoprotein-sorting protein [Fulvivirgaceae bacterium BMA10]|uniref:Outer membrane lipoprotein-sorting protein n=1 Tax=Splendidivirga corallicola TaxID=3051826 RepID=A0ABT8KS80_9BACT|nr:outer membrane lipoprotein-sorting protein [Fulvivirgaceae bacterium BMA10]